MMLDPLPLGASCVLVACLGVCLGSFAHAAAVRMVLAEDPVKQPSACFKCRKTLTIWQNIPLFSFIRQHGKCACGDVRLPARYLFSEAGMGIVAVALWLLYEPVLAALLLLCITLCLIQAIHDWLSLTLDTRLTALIALGGAALTFIDDWHISLASAMLSAVTGYVIVAVTVWLYRLWRKVDGYGAGDKWLMAAVASYTEMPVAIGLFFAANMLGAVFSMIVMQRQGSAQRTDEVLGQELDQGSGQSKIAFGSFILLATLLWLLGSSLIAIR